MSSSRPATLLILPCAVLALTLGACSKTPEAPATPPATNPAAAPAPAPAPTPAPTTMTMQRATAPAGVKISFVGIKTGDAVTSPVKFSFGLEGAKIAPAGTTEPGTGHFHVIVDSELPAQDAPLPASDKVIHFGKGQTEAELTLTPGPHTLQLEFTDGSHMPFEPAVTSDKIEITVK
jgi:hypothetical protein